jgi:hypothetical protein
LSKNPYSQHCFVLPTLNFTELSLGLGYLISVGMDQ